MSDTVRLVRVVPVAAVSAEEAKIARLLARGGYDVTVLDLIPLAQAVVARAAIAKVRAAGAQIASASWRPRADGGVEIEFHLLGDDDLIVAKIAAG